MRIIAFLFGLILLFPGACALGFLVMGVTALPPLGSGEWRDSGVWGMIGIATIGWGFCFLISFGGMMIIRGAVKPSVKPPPQDSNEHGPN